jgi:hypothetical protein
MLGVEKLEIPLSKDRTMQEGLPACIGVKPTQAYPGQNNFVKKAF